MQNEDNSITQLTRLDYEWMTLVGLREIYHLTTKSPPHYEDMLGIALQTVPEIFSDDSQLLLHFQTSALEIYREIAESQSKTEGRTVKVDEILLSEIHLTEQRIATGGSARRLRQHLQKLKRLYVQESGEEYSEYEVIERDGRWSERYSSHKSEVILPISDNGRDYREFELPNAQVLRLRIAHPGKLEAITGADIVYEHYDSSCKQVRLVALQYKMWDGKELYFKPGKESERIKRQISRLETSFCKEICKRQSENNRRFRMPSCAAYLRPTDKLQLRSKLQTTGHHVPVCELDALWQNTTKKEEGIERESGRKLTSRKLENYSVSMPTFEELFNSQMLGSNWIATTELEALYKTRISIPKPIDSLVFHAQTYRRMDNST